MCSSTIPIPIYVKHNIQFREGGSGRFELTVGPKQTMGKTVRGHPVVDSHLAFCHIRSSKPW